MILHSFKLSRILKECSFHRFASLTNLDQSNSFDQGILTEAIHFHCETLNKCERYLNILVLEIFVIELLLSQLERLHSKCTSVVFTLENLKRIAIVEIQRPNVSVRLSFFSFF